MQGKNVIMKLPSDTWLKKSDIILLIIIIYFDKYEKDKAKEISTHEINGTIELMQIEDNTPYEFRFVKNITATRKKFKKHEVEESLQRIMATQLEYKDKNSYGFTNIFASVFRNFENKFNFSVVFTSFIRNLVDTGEFEELMIRLYNELPKKQTNKMPDPVITDVPSGLAELFGFEN